MDDIYEKLVYDFYCDRSKIILAITALQERDRHITKLESESERLKAENAALKEAQRWIPVGERLPEEAQEIYAREYNGIFTHFKYSKKLYEIFIRHYTHWRPLPQPPEAE